MKKIIVLGAKGFIGKNLCEFFDNLEKNWNYQEVYKNYLEVRLKVYKSINVLYAKNSECLISGDQEISNEQVDEAKKDLDEFVEKYGS